MGRQVLLPGIDAINADIDPRYAYEMLQNRRFEGTINLPKEFELRKCVVQRVCARRLPLDLSFIFFPKHNRVIKIYHRLTLDVSLRILLLRAGIRREHQRYIARLSRRMLTAYVTGKRKPSKRWLDRYEKYIKPYMRFKQPHERAYVLTTVSIRPPREKDFREFILAYDPVENAVYILSGPTWKKLGMKRPVYTDLLEDTRKLCLNYWKSKQTQELFH